MSILKSRKAFTIVEVVIVIAIIAVLAAVLVPTFGYVIVSAHDSAARQEAKNSYTDYIVENAGKGYLPALFLYQADENRVVALQNGSVVGVFKTQEEVLRSYAGDNYEADKLKATSDEKLFVYIGDTLAQSESNALQKESIIGKKISFMGDSISTFEGWSNNGAYNSTLADNRVMYNVKGNAVYQDLVSVDETWWMRTVNKLRLEFCVNNSFSGSRVTAGGSYPNEVGCGDRAINLHNDQTGEMPDIIVIFMGTNDYQQIGSAVSVNEFARDYKVMIGKIKNEYPDADVYVCTLPKYDYITAGLPIEPAAFNEKIESIASEYDFNIVDFYNGTGMTPDNLKTYTVDLLINKNDTSLVHPNSSGMGKMFECVKEALAENYLIEVAPKETYSVTFDMNQSLIAEEYPSSVSEGDELEITLSLSLGSLTITMGGRPIDCYDHNTGKVFIPYVTGNVVITSELMKYMNELPAGYDSTTNLCSEDLITRKGFYSSPNTWTDRDDLIAAIFPVSGGMMIRSSSFVHTSGQYRGTVIAWFMNDGTMQTVAQIDVYDQQTTIGYVTVPEGAIAICMVWRSNCMEEACQNNYMYITLPE